MAAVVPIAPRPAGPDPALLKVFAVDAGGPFFIAQAFLQDRYTSQDERCFVYWRGDYYTYIEGAYRVLGREDARAEVYRYLVETHRKATRRTVDDVLDALRAVAKLPDPLDAPRWLLLAADPGELIAFRNGLLNLRTRALLPATASYFNLNAVDFDYAADASPPALWLTFLAQLWPGDPVSIATLAEIIGYILSGDTRLQKAFLLIGPPRSGKGTVARILRLLVGVANVAAPMLANLGAPFGLQELIGKLLAIISDARLSGRADVQAIVENMLRVSGEDPITVPRKFLPDYTGQLRVRFLLLSNEVPALADASGALASRFVILRLTHSFLGREDPHLLERLLPELPGILLWALDGLDRLRTRGAFLQPDSGADVVHDMRALASPLGQFIEDECWTQDPEASVPVKVLFESWRAWSLEEGRESTWTKELFGSRLRSVVPHVRIHRGPRDIAGKRSRQYAGIRLRQAVDKGE